MRNGTGAPTPPPPGQKAKSWLGGRRQDRQRAWPTGVTPWSASRGPQTSSTSHARRVAPQHLRGLGGIATLHRRSPTSHHIREEIYILYLNARGDDAAKPKQHRARVPSARGSSCASTPPARSSAGSSSRKGTPPGPTACGCPPSAPAAAAAMGCAGELPHPPTMGRGVIQTPHSASYIYGESRMNSQL